MFLIKQKSSSLLENEITLYFHISKKKYTYTYYEKRVLYKLLKSTLSNGQLHGRAVGTQ